MLSNQLLKNSQSCINPVYSSGTNKLKTLFVSITLLLSFSSTAQSIASWTFAGTLAGNAGAYNSVDPITIGPGVGSSGYYSSSEFYGEDGWPSGALSNNAYIQFRMTPSPGYQLNIGTIVLRMRRSQTGIPSGSGPTRWALRSNQDGYTSNIATGTLTTSYQNFTINPGSSFVGVTGNISFRLYGYQQSTGILGENRLVIDEINVYSIGTVLPVKLTSFSGVLVDQNVELKWNAADISAGTVFSVERSLSGNDFTEIKKLSEYSDAGTKQYMHTDIPSGSTVFYRIKVQEPSGLISYSSIIKVSSTARQTDRISFIYVGATQVRTKLQVSKKGSYQCILYTAMGLLVYKTDILLEKGENAITLSPPHLSQGNYILSVRSASMCINKAFVK